MKAAIVVLSDPKGGDEALGRVFNALAAAYDFCASTDHNSAIYAELWAIKACSSKAFFPWNADLKNYSFPEHLAGIVNPTNGDVDRAELDKRLQEIQPYVNV